MEAADALPLAPIEIATALRDKFGFASARPHEIHSLITQLGPRRFITTNYDTLIEQQLGLDGKLGNFRTVTSKQLAELADIVKASADNFIFKPHGDISSGETIVLSSEQYERVILGERNIVRNCLETIFVTRPAIFVGYGLRDPDTSLILRTLRDRFLGNVAHFVAIVADATGEEIDYWWQRYRIRIFGYSTKHNGADHSELLHLLRLLAKPDHVVNRTEKTRVKPSDSNKRINLFRSLPSKYETTVRYAARLIHARPDIVFTTYVRLGFRSIEADDPTINRYHNQTIEKLFLSYPHSFILQGSAGSGKSFAIANFLTVAGTAIIDRHLGKSELNAATIPILLDARLYSGSFSELAAATVPASLDLNALSETTTITVIIDSVDEMPDNELNSGMWRKDLEVFIGKFIKKRVIFGTRKADLAGRSDLPIFHVDGLTDQTVENHLSQSGIDGLQHKSPELIESLKTPFLLMLALRFIEKIDHINSAPDLLDTFIDQALANLSRNEPHSFIEKSIQQVAYHLVEMGRENIPAKQAVEIIRRGATSVSSAIELVNDLVRIGIMISEIDDHVRFAHRTVTEYLASGHIIELKRLGDLNLLNLLAVPRWDNAIVWASCKIDSLDEGFIDQIYRIDPVLAYRIVISAEANTFRIWKAFLGALARSPPNSDVMHNICYLENETKIPPGLDNELRLLTLNPGNELRGWALSLHAQKASSDEIENWIDMLGRGEIEYNTSNICGASLGERLTGSALDYFWKALKETQLGEENDENEKYDEASKRHGFETAISGLSTESLNIVLARAKQESEVVRGIICQGVRERIDVEAKKFILSEFDRGSDQAIFCVYLGSKYRRTKNRFDLPRFAKSRAKMLLRKLDEEKNAQWPFCLLVECAKRDDKWLAFLSAEASVSAIAITMNLPTTPPAAVRRFVKSALKQPKALSNLERYALSELASEYGNTFTITEKEFFSSLKRNGRETLKVFSDFFNGHQSKRCIDVSLDKIDDWISCLAPLFQGDRLADGSIEDSILEYVARAWSTDGRDRLLARGNNSHDPHRDLILAGIIPHFRGITTEELTSEAAKRLLEIYLEGQIDFYRSPGLIATEKFVETTVLPLRKSAAIDQERVERVINDAEKRIDKRFFN